MSYETDDAQKKFEDLGISQLASMSSFLAMSRKLGFAVTATPQAIEMLHRARTRSAPLVLANVCPIDEDPWAEAYRARVKVEPA